MKSNQTTCLFLLLITSLIYAEVWTYSYPDVCVPPTQAWDDGTSYTTFNKRSERYAVSVTQGDSTYGCYVMHSNRPHTSGNLSRNPHAHWTNFSWSGEVTVRIENLNGDITSCDLFPLRKGYTAEITGKSAVFVIDSENQTDPLQLYVRINNDNAHTLFIFADPPETDVPDRSDTEHVDIIRTTDDIATVRTTLLSSKTYAVFEEGVHQWEGGKNTDYEGYLMPVRAGKRIYLPGGAYVIGTFSGDNQNGFKIYGRGVLSACGKDRLPGSASIPYSMVHAGGSGSRDQIVEGIVSTDAPHFHLTFRGQVDIDNVKMLGWWYQVDGIVTGNNSSITNCFFKVNDDYIKVYSQNCYFRNNTMFQQVNGAPFQFCWGGQNGDNNLIEDTYLVGCVYTGSGTKVGNNAFINARKGSNAVTQNNTWNGVYIDNGCRQFIGLNGENEAGTIFRSFLIKNVILNSGYNTRPQDSGSYLADGTKRNFDGIMILNMVVDGDTIHTYNTGRDYPDDGALWFWANGNYVDFTKVRFNYSEERIVLPVGDSLVVEVEASDLDGAAVSAQLYLDDRLVSQKTTRPFIWNDDGKEDLLHQLPTGQYLLHADVVYPGNEITRIALPLIVYDPVLPEGWFSEAIGEVSVPGYAEYQADQWTIDAGGEGIKNRADGFHYVFRRASGDMEITCRIDAFLRPDERAVAGLMIRESTAPQAPHVSALIEGGVGYLWQRRTRAWTSALQKRDVIDGGVSIPAWLKLVKTGDVYMGYHSADGQVWTLADSNEVALSDTVFIGLAVAGSHPKEAAFARFSQVMITGGQPVSVATGKTEMPSEFVLEQNYPNPFNPLTTIRYQLPAICRVRAEVYSAEGRLVSVLADGEQVAGRHEAGFDGSGLASGVYFVQFMAIGESKSAVKRMKMVLLK